MKKKKYFIYARSAVKPQKGEYSNNNTQVELLKGLAKKKGFEIADVISEYGSGKNDERPSFLKMLQRLKKGDAQGILCTSWDRLTRNIVTLSHLHEMFYIYGIKINTLNTNEKKFEKFYKILLYLRRSA